MSATTGPFQQSEAYVDAATLAALMGVHVKTVRKWAANGMPSETWGLRCRRFLPSQAMAWVRHRRLP